MNKLRFSKKIEENFEKRKLIRNIETELPCDPDGSAAFVQ